MIRFNNQNMFWRENFFLIGNGTKGAITILLIRDYSGVLLLHLSFVQDFNNSLKKEIVRK